MKYLKLIIAIVLILVILRLSVADINHGHGIEEHGRVILLESRV